MNRRATPDSEAVASSEDDIPWPRQTFGSMPRSNENGMPGLGGGIWSPNSRGSFKLDQDARRMAAFQAQFGSSAMVSGRSAMTPSPTMHDVKTAPFSIPLRPTAKPGRSLSHSHGQREMPAAMLHVQAGADRGGLPLDLVNESEETDSDSEPDHGHSLTQTTSHPVTGLYQRTSMFPSHFESVQNQNDRMYSEATLGDRLGNALEGTRLDGIQRNKQRWQTTSSGWDELHTINESRRHSLAGELPTRRGSLADSHDQELGMRSPHGYNDQHNKYNVIDNDTFTIPDGYRVPHITLDAHERADIQQSINMQAQNRPRKELYIVSFKCSRAGVFYLLDNTGLTVEEGNMVIVEADRGQDLGTVQHARVSPEEARALLVKYSEEQYKWLMMFSRNNQAGAVNPNAAVYGENRENGNQDYSGRPNMPSARAPRDQFQNLKPKAIKRMAAAHEIRMLKEKEGNEAKAKRCCQQKVFQHHLDMEILESEFQWDWQKLIFYYYADHYVNFKELVNDLYKLYKVRLWMSAVNPASFSPNAINSPPSGIGPGAITNFDPFRSPGFDDSYAMAYGNDPDPYGAIPPYQVGYNTYVPNYPSIPGVPNSFAPVPGDGTPAQPGHGQWPTATGSSSTSGSTVTASASSGGVALTPIGSPPANTLQRAPSFGSSYYNPALSQQRGDTDALNAAMRGMDLSRGFYGGPAQLGAAASYPVRPPEASQPATWSSPARPGYNYPLSPSSSFANRQQAGIDGSPTKQYGPGSNTHGRGPPGSSQSYSGPGGRR